MLDKFERDFKYCTHCPKMCRFACPVANAEFRETVTPWGKMAAAGEILNGRREADEQTLSLLAKCTGCRLCQTYCDHSINVASALQAAREQVLSTIGGAENYPNAEELIVDGELLHEKLQEIAGREWQQPDAATVYFPGCKLPIENPQHVATTLELFRLLHVGDVTVYSDFGGCCGYPLYEAGHTEAFMRVARQNVLEFNRYKTIVCEDPECVTMLKQVYQKLGLPIATRVMHITEFLKSYLKDAKFKPVEGNYFYHDSCYLGRHLGLYDLPRELLRRGLSAPLRELQWNREASYCCGAGDLYARTSPKGAQAIGHNLLQPLLDEEKPTLVTFCSRCAMHLDSLDSPVTIKHGLSLLSEALES